MPPQIFKRDADRNNQIPAWFVNLILGVVGALALAVFVYGMSAHAEAMKDLNATKQEQAVLKEVLVRLEKKVDEIGLDVRAMKK